MPFAQRKPLRLKQWDYSSPGMYFVTFCAYERKCILGSIPGEALGNDGAVCVLSELGEICRQAAALAVEGGQGAVLDSFVIMPNHVHALISLSGGEGSQEELGRRIAGWKALATKEARRNGFTEKLWQAGFHDHIIRNEADLARIREYMQNNPKQWQLDRYHCKTAPPRFGGVGA
ncbi:transposase [Parvibacter caecicola]|uniref:transposase n=1 Tax=Parvibacter caecicola TaxID=747645 RepID=UPI00272EF8CA|nr:transposase [Parvibacter caecicola]